MLKISASRIAVSALKALEKKADVTANNIANANTDGFKARRVLFETGKASGVLMTITEMNTPGMTQSDGSESSNVNLSDELLDLITTQQAYSTNIQVIEADGEMQKYLLDVFT